MDVFHHQNAGQNHRLLLIMNLFVAKLEYLGTVTNQNCIDNKIKSRLNLSSHLLLTNMLHQILLG